MGDEMPRVTGIHHVTNTLTNLERSVAWYRKALGFLTELSAEHQNGTGRFTIMANPEFPVVFSLHVDSDTVGESFPETHSGLDHEFVNVEDHSSLEEWEHHLTDVIFGHSALTHRPFDGQSAHSVMVFRDPDNVQLEFFSMA
jgi:glyoxylase I family protein